MFQKSMSFMARNADIYLQQLLPSPTVMLITTTQPKPFPTHGCEKRQRNYVSEETNHQAYRAIAGRTRSRGGRRPRYETHPSLLKQAMQKVLSVNQKHVRAKGNLFVCLIVSFLFFLAGLELRQETATGCLGRHSNVEIANGG